MIIAISTTGSNPEANMDPRFGRADGFLLYNLDDDTFRFLGNTQNIQAAHGAGIQAAQLLVDEKVQAVITGQCGPKALTVLTSAGIPVFEAPEGTVAARIFDFRQNRLREASLPKGASLL